jgi:hypothetical protein
MIDEEQSAASHSSLKHRGKVTQYRLSYIVASEFKRQVARRRAPAFASW